MWNSITIIIVWVYRWGAMVAAVVAKWKRARNVICFHGDINFHNLFTISNSSLLLVFCKFLDFLHILNSNYSIHSWLLMHINTYCYTYICRPLNSHAFGMRLTYSVSLIIIIIYDCGFRNNIEIYAAIIVNMSALYRPV